MLMTLYQDPRNKDGQERILQVKVSFDCGVRRALYCKVVLNFSFHIELVIYPERGHV